ncbi:DUF3891 family protein [Sinobaca sp. H24]|uniref:DUF3891 family protein n=1 Tax=Sinobaca sp. H24 TaxID=2923376 RepID=UPI00207A2B66|nr:DUF3891 family protein [Sinobaca sp. H24]
MIVQEFSSYYFLIEQHEHARLSAEAAARINNPDWKEDKSGIRFCMPSVNMIMPGYPWTRSFYLPQRAIHTLF